MQGQPATADTNPALRNMFGLPDAQLRWRIGRPGGTVVSTGGTTVRLPGRGGATTTVAIVRDPNNLFLVLLPAPR